MTALDRSRPPSFAMRGKVSNPSGNTNNALREFQGVNA